MKKYILPALLAMTLVCGANAQITTASRVPLPVNKVDKVPDSGSTAALLALSVGLVILTQRKLAKS
jgi:hypothetical protein